MRIKEIQDNICLEYLNNIPIHIIKKKYRTSYETIKKFCLYKGIWKGKERSDYIKKLRGIDKRLTKENPFNNSRDSYYYLGLLATDGSVSNNCISLILQKRDSDIIEQFKLFCKSKNKLSFIKDKRFLNSESVGLSFRNKDIKDYLISLGITERKSLTLKINFPLNWDFIRGVIDGDGCISFYKSRKKYKCSISIATASIDFANQISYFLHSEDIHNKIYKYSKNHKNPIFHVNITCFKNCKKLISNLYNDTDTYIKRKYLKAQLISNYQLKTDLKLRELVSKNPEASQQLIVDI